MSPIIEPTMFGYKMFEIIRVVTIAAALMGIIFIKICWPQLKERCSKAELSMFGMVWVMCLMMLISISLKCL